MSLLRNERPRRSIGGIGYASNVQRLSGPLYSNASRADGFRLAVASAAYAATLDLTDVAMYIDHTEINIMERHMALQIANPTVVAKVEHFLGETDKDDKPKGKSRNN